MRNSLLSVVLQMTSSRQSPRISAHSAGVALVPLLEVQPSAVRRRVSEPSVQFHLEIVLRSSNSRSKSASHQTPQLQERGLRSEICSPLTFQTPRRPAPDAHISYPR